MERHYKEKSQILPMLQCLRSDLHLSSAKHKEKADEQVFDIQF